MLSLIPKAFYADSSKLSHVLTFNMTDLLLSLMHKGLVLQPTIISSLASHLFCTRVMNQCVVRILCGFIMYASSNCLSCLINSSKSPIEEKKKKDIIQRKTERQCGQKDEIKIHIQIFKILLQSTTTETKASTLRDWNKHSSGEQISKTHMNLLQHADVFYCQCAGPCGVHLFLQTL